MKDKKEKEISEIKERDIFLIESIAVITSVLTTIFIISLLKTLQ